MKERRPLEGLKVLDLTTNISGPVTTHILSSLGATVWKVERPEGGDDARQMAPVVGGMSAYFLAINGAKKSVAMDLTNRRSRGVVKKLIKSADVLVENFRPGVAEKLGVGWRQVRVINPKLIYASISGYGDKGPDSARPGYDMLLQARTGLISVTGHAGQPPARIGVSILDVGSGVWTALGVLTALLGRNRTKHGQRISTSLLETGAFLFAYHLLSYQLTGNLPTPHGTEHPAFSPYGSFKARQEGRIFIGVSNDRQFRRLCDCLGHSEWAKNPLYGSNVKRVTNRERLRVQIDNVLSEKDAEAWERLLTEADVPVAQLRNARGVLGDAQAEALSLFQKIKGPGKRPLKVPRIPVRFSESLAGKKELTAPRLGEHTREVLRSVGFTGLQIARLESEKAIKQYSGAG